MESEELEYVGFWPRVGASIVDTVLAFAILIPVLTWILRAVGLYSPRTIGDLSELLARASAHPMSILAGSAVGSTWQDFLLSYVVPAVAIVLFWIYREATPGKMLIGARIVDAKTGGHPTTRQLIVRYLGYYVSIFGLFLGFVWVAFDPRKQGWHDKMAGTVVVRPKHRGPKADHFDAG
jgi:uncharacterized RDD family membrane protein YckC